MRKAILSTLTLAFLSCSVSAETTNYSQRYDACMNNAGTTVAMQNCIAEEYTSQDARLNQAYKKLTAALSTSRKKELQAAQRLWIQYRDANCQFYADPDGGSIATINAASCTLQMTTQRAQELENFTQ